MVTLDIARTPEDFEQCLVLLQKTHPADDQPSFGGQFAITFVVRDHEEPSVIRGVIHADFVPEIRSMSVDPDYRFQDASFTLLHQYMEGHFRVNNHKAVFHTVPKDKERLIKMLKKSGAEEINQNDTRFRKVL